MNLKQKYNESKSKIKYMDPIEKLKYGTLGATIKNKTM